MYSRKREIIYSVLRCIDKLVCYLLRSKGELFRSQMVPGGLLPKIGDPDVDPKRNVGNISGVVRVPESSDRSPLCPANVTWRYYFVTSSSKKGENLSEKQ